MGRQVRKVPADWKHPRLWDPIRSNVPKPLYEGYRYELDKQEWYESLLKHGLQATLEELGQAPDKRDYMPDWPATQRTHYMMYENTSEGTPISPAFATVEELARWLADTKASVFADYEATYERWLEICKNGSAGFTTVKST